MNIGRFVASTVFDTVLRLAKISIILTTTAAGRTTTAAILEKKRNKEKKRKERKAEEKERETENRNRLFSILFCSQDEQRTYHPRNP